MATKGRKPTPSKLKVLRGNPGKRPIPKNEPEPPASGKFYAPSYIKSKIARAAYKELATKLNAVGIYTHLDEIALELVCTCYARYRDSYHKARVKVLYTASGAVVAHPLINVEIKYLKELRALMSEFGMTPSARARLGTDLEDRDPLEDFLGKRPDDA